MLIFKSLSPELEHLRLPCLPTESPPVITAHTQELYAAEGETVRLPCEATGVPAPQISWYRNR